MDPVFKAPVFDQVANYPVECRARFLALCDSRSTATPGRIRHFLSPQIDQVLDDYLVWLAVYGDA